MMDLQVAFAAFVLLGFNLPILVLVVRLPLLADLGAALKEKDPIGGASDTTSYSRVVGLVGAVVLTAFFWAIGDLVIYDAFTAPAAIDRLVGAARQMILVGAALFLPYAANQIRSAFASAGVAAASVNAGALTPVAAAPPVGAPKGPVLNITVANLSTALDDASFSAIVAAIAIQVSRDFQPEWGTGAKLTPQRIALTASTANIDGATDAVVYVGDFANDPTSGTDGAFGYHAANFGALPYGFVYLDVCAQYGERWSTTLSHEVLELLADPTAVMTVSGPAPGAAGQMVSYDLEICDPTQGDTYKINAIAVSNFVNKAYFNMAGGANGTNHLGLPLASFGVRPGGYCQYEDSAGAHQINGAKVDAQRLAARAMLQQYRRNARRAAGTANRV